MTVSTECPPERALGAVWRARAARAQEAALPCGSAVVSCAATPGVAGLGRHLAEIVAALERREQPTVCISRAGGQLPGPSPLRMLRIPGVAAALAPIGRVSPAWRVWRARVEFDAHAARRLPAAEHLIAFNRQALAQFGAARSLGYRSWSLMSGSAHVRRVARRHAAAHRLYPLERSYGTHVARRYLEEYAQASRVYVTSRCSWESFVEAGYPEEKLSLFPLTPDPRFTPAAQEPATGTFDVVYVGGLSVVKGVPLLIDAVRRLPHPDLRLVLVGGWGTRGMRRFVERACAEDPRISAGPGDPLPKLREARLCVHPSYTDGFCYGAAEALACGVPVIASEDTGMKDLIQPGRTGAVLPTGDLDALAQAIDAAYRGELLGG
jgi:glycosyltransferase involved in cell wall biosynthesis